MFNKKKTISKTESKIKCFLYDFCSIYQCLVERSRNLIQISRLRLRSQI
jgi:hypothetical protein